MWLGLKENIHCEFLDYSYHTNPIKLNNRLQEIIDESQDCEIIILTYGNCSNSFLGLISKKVPLLFPATCDCFELLLGSKELRLKLHEENPFVYYFSQGWLDYGRDPYSECLEYEKKYGQENADFFIQSMYGHYNKTIFITSPGIKNIDFYRKKVKFIAEFFGWEVGEVAGDLSLLARLLKGVNDSGMIYIEPGTKITEKFLWQFEK